MDIKLLKQLSKLTYSQDCYKCVKKKLMRLWEVRTERIALEKQLKEFKINNDFEKEVYEKLNQKFHSLVEEEKNIENELKKVKELLKEV